MSSPGTETVASIGGLVTPALAACALANGGAEWFAARAIVVESELAARAAA